jgi:diguanylate cyclase
MSAGKLTSPSQIARETIRQLAVRKLSPTPENYAKIYAQIAGRPEPAEVQPAARPACYAAAAPQADARVVKAEDQDVIEGLVLLLQLLLSNISELSDDDRWLKSQVDRLREIVRTPIDAKALAEMQGRLREVIFRQSTMKRSLDEAKQALKQMLAAFIDRLASMSAQTGTFQGRVEGYAARIAQASNLPEISNLVQDLLHDTRGMHGEVTRAREELEEARRRAEEANGRVRNLEAELERVGEMVRADQLTTALNRRGLDEAFQTEAARGERSGKPLAIALLDLDNFKALNDRLGHQAGDSALVHLVNVVREAIRPTDVIGRYGGEEFVILLPDTGLDEADAVMVRVQRALTRRFFLHNNERLLITFSCGIAQLTKGETWAQALDRADRALYDAKHQGKNRTVRASDRPQPKAA